MSFSTDKFYVSHFTRTHNLKKILASRSLQPVNLQKALDPKFVEPDYYESAAEYGNQGKYGRSNFYSIIFPDSKGKPIFRTHNKVGELSETYVYFIFSPRIIEDNAKMVGNHGVIEPPVFCKGWTYGKVTKENCNYYDSSISLKENLNNWRNSIIKGIQKYEKDPYTENLVQPESLTIATEIMIEGEMPLDLDLMYIFIPKNNFVPGQYPKSFYKKMPDMREMEKKLKNEYDDADKELQELMDKYPELPWTRDDPFNQYFSSYFIHNASIPNGKSILKDGKLKIANELDEESQDIYEETPDKVFFQYLEDKLYSPLLESKYAFYLFFKPTIFRDYEGLWTPSWSYGEEREHSYRYNKVLTLEENLENISKIMQENCSETKFDTKCQNELSIPYSIPLEGNLVGVYIYDKDLRERLRKEFPEIRFVNKNDKDFKKLFRDIKE